MAARKGYAGLSKEETRAAFPAALDILRSHYLSKCLSIAIKLDVATIIGRSGEPLTTEAIAKETGHKEVNLNYLQRILRYLSSKGIFTEHPGPKFSLTSISQLFRTDITDQFSMKPGAMISSVSSFAPMWNAWGHLEDCVLSNTRKVPFIEANGKPFFEYLAENPDESSYFNAWMTQMSTSSSKRICDVFADEWKNLKPGTRIMDVGGGQGIVMKTLKDAYPDLHCMVFDLPEVVSRVTDKPANIEFVGGSFFEPESLPKVDMIMIKNVIHDWGDEECIKIFKSCAAAVPSGGKILIIESMMPEPGELDEKSNMAGDIQMLIFGGMDRTLSDWKRCFSASGIEFKRFIPSCHIIETVKL